MLKVHYLTEVSLQRWKYAEYILQKQYAKKQLQEIIDFFPSESKNTWASYDFLGGFHKSKEVDSVFGLKFSHYIHFPWEFNISWNGSIP